MPKIVLTRVSDPSADPWLAAVSSDYEVPEDAHVFAGTGLYGERVAFWIGADGGGFGAIDSKPELYVRASAAMAGCPEDADAETRAATFALMAEHGGVEEYVFEPDTYSYAAKRLSVDAETSFAGI